MVDFKISCSRSQVIPYIVRYRVALTKYSVHQAAVRQGQELACGAVFLHFPAKPVIMTDFFRP